MRTWATEEVAGRGTRHILTIDPGDGTNPMIVRGWSKDEVLEKVAHSLETGQAIINRQRAAAMRPVQSAAQPAAPAPQQPAKAAVTAEELANATIDLSNPARAPQAIKTLLRGAGVDLDAQTAKDEAGRVVRIATAWEQSNPDFPADDRNRRVLLNTAAKNVGFKNIDAAALDAAYQEMLSFGMVFEDSRQPDNNPPTPQSDGSSSRVERPRGATSYNARDLRAARQPVANKPRYTRAQVDALTSAQLRDKIEHEPGFKEWYDREFSPRPAVA